MWKTRSLLKSQVELLVLGMDLLESQSRRKLLLLHGIREEKDEDVLRKTIELLYVKSTSIDLCHRLGTKKNSARPVLDRFSSLRLRSSVWKENTLLKGSKVTMTEFLTKSRQEVFVSARKHFGIKKCWSAEGIL